MQKNMPTIDSLTIIRKQMIFSLKFKKVRVLIVLQKENIRSVQSDLPLESCAYDSNMVDKRYVLFVDIEQFGNVVHNHSFNEFSKTLCKLIYI